MSQISPILLTGGSGFLGKHVLDSSNKRAMPCLTIGRRPLTNSWKHIAADISSNIPQLPDLLFQKVIHVAGKAHVFPKTPEEEKDFFDVNVEGTRNLLKALDQLSFKPHSFVFISSVAVYGLTTGNLIPESTPLSANTPYGKSKVEAERIIQEWCSLHQIPCLILRLPLLAGKNPPGNLGDMLSAIKKGYYVKIGENKAQKSVVLAEDISDFILRLDSDVNGIFHLTDGSHPSFSEIEKAFETGIGKKIKLKIPMPIVQLLAKCGDLLAAITKKDILPISSSRLQKITSPLTFDDTKARQQINWTASPVIDFIKNKI